ncbi:MAG: hypothetical protein V4503_09560 [Gemmatimonadota bacterium]
MPPTFRFTWAAALCLAVVAAPARLPAQLGGLARKAKAALGVEKTTTSVAAAGPVANKPVVIRPTDRIDAESIELFSQALEVERTWLEERARIRKGLRPLADYRDCADGAVQRSPEGARLLKMYTDAVTSSENDGSAEYMTRLANRMKAEQEKIVFAACGYDPGEYAAEPSASPARPSEYAAAAKVGLDQRRYAILKERVTPFCALDAAERGDGDVRVRGIGYGIFYVYDRAEAEVLAPRCDALRRAIQAII